MTRFHYRVHQPESSLAGLRFNFSSAYTLIESIVVIFIMVMMLTLLLANYNTGRNQQKLSKTVSEAVSALREVQNDALGGLQVGSPGTGIDAYGIDFTKTTTYTLFADKNSNYLFDAPDAYIDPGNASRTFLDGITPSVYVNCSGTSQAVVNNADVTFQPPWPTVKIRKDGAVADCDVLCVMFVSPGGQTRTKVRVTKASGLIESINESTAGAVSCP